MKTALLLAAAMSASMNVGIFAQTAPPGDAGAIRLRALPAVLDARERRMDWHEAAQQAEAPIQDPALKQQLIARLSGVAPRVAKALAGQPQADALVSVAVFKQAGAEGKPAMIAVTFDGLGEEIGGDFFGTVLAGEAKPPEAEGIPQGLVFDPEASSYLVFFLGNRGLQAGDISQAAMKQSVLAAINHQRELAAQQNQAAVQQQANAAAAAQQQQTDAAAQQAAAQQQANSAVPPQDYYDDGYYYPGEGVPIVILPNGYADTADWRKHEREREERLEKLHAVHRNAAVNNPASGVEINAQRAAGAPVNSESPRAINPAPAPAAAHDGPVESRTPADAPHEAPAESRRAPAPAAHEAPAAAHEAPAAAHEAPAPAGHEAPAAAHEAPAPAGHK